MKFLTATTVLTAVLFFGCSRGGGTDHHKDKPEPSSIPTAQAVQTPLPPQQACLPYIDAAYAKGINDTVGFLSQVRKGGTAKAANYDIHVTGASASDLAACVTCGEMLVKEGLSFFHHSEASPAPSPAATVTTQSKKK